MGSHIVPEGVCPGLQGNDDVSGQWLGKDCHSWGFYTSIDGQEEFDCSGSDFGGNWYHVAGCSCRAGLMVVYNIGGISLMQGVGLPVALTVVKEHPCLEASIPLPLIILAVSI